MSTMRALLATAFGEPSQVLTFGEAVIPQPPPRAALVRVRAAGVNFADAMLIRGSYQVKPPLPFIGGAEIAGEVVACGEHSTLQVGERVAAQVLGFGAYSEYTIVEDRRAIRVPAEWSLSEAAAFPIAAITAELALQAADELRSGDVVVVHGGAGAVGLAAVELAKLRGCKVVALARTPERRALARSRGADHDLDSGSPDWWKEVQRFTDGAGAAAIIDPIGGDTSVLSLRCLAWRGTLCLVGFASGAPAKLPANHLLVKAQSARGIYWAYDRDDARLDVIQRRLEQFASCGHLRPIVGREYTFAEGIDAIRAAESGRSGGKIVLRVSED